MVFASCSSEVISLHPNFCVHSCDCVSPRTDKGACPLVTTPELPAAASTDEADTSVPGAVSDEADTTVAGAASDEADTTVAGAASDEADTTVAGAASGEADTTDKGACSLVMVERVELAELPATEPGIVRPISILHARADIDFSFPTIFATEDSSHTSRKCIWSPQILYASISSPSFSTTFAIVFVIISSSFSSSHTGLPSFT